MAKAVSLPVCMQSQVVQEPPVTTDASGFAMVPLTIEVEPVPVDEDYGPGYYSPYDYGADDNTFEPSVALGVMATTPGGDRVFHQLTFVSLDGFSFQGYHASATADREVVAIGALLHISLAQVTVANTHCCCSVLL